MKKGWIIGAGLAAIPFFLIKPGRACEEKKKPFFGRNIAHRGLYSKDQNVPENSLPAFQKAREQGYGVELDVQLSKDGKVVVFHDDDLKRACGIQANVKDLSYSSLRRLKLFQTEERIPLFQEVLQVLQGEVPLVVELKTGEKNRQLCKKTVEILKSYSGPVCIESFNPLIVSWFRHHAPQYLRGQLAQQPEEYEKSGIPKIGGILLGNTLLNFWAGPEFIAYRIGKKPFLVKTAELFGAIPVAWTSHHRRHEKGNDFVIFEHYLPKQTYKS